MDDRRSTTGNVFMFGNGAVSWSSTKQNVIALSTTEAEYIAACSTACQAVWMRRLLADMGKIQDEATPIFCDNKSTISIANNPIHHGRTKHIDIRFHFIRELITDGSITLQYCATDQQVADIFTKALSIYKFKELRSKLGVCSLQSRGDVGSD